MQVIDFVVELMVEAFSRSATDFEIWNPVNYPVGTFLRVPEEF